MRNKGIWSKRTAAAAVALLITLNAGRISAHSSGLPVTKLVPMGQTVGIKLDMDGVMIVSLSKVETVNGDCAPAEAAGLREGDIISEVNSERVVSCMCFKQLLNKYFGGSVKLKVLRSEQELTLDAVPVKGVGGSAEIGAWIRDSIAGIGTMTFYDRSSGIFGTLGHGISDSDTGVLMPLREGSILPSMITSVKKGQAGQPGELKGSFDFDADLGELRVNSQCGVFGKMRDGELPGGEELPVAEASEIRVGSAVILSNVEGDRVEEYAIDISRIYPNPAENLKCMMITVTDKRLLEKTGGIVQGMSGSPIIQNGKLVGALTHVLINNPAKGYGISIESMLCEGYGEMKAAS